MTHMRNTFSTIANKSCSADAWRRVFLNFDHAQWKAEGGGILYNTTSDNLEYSLSLVYSQELGIVLHLACRDLSTNRITWHKLSIGNPMKLSAFETVDDISYPVGCFIPAEQAWLAVEDFLSGSIEPSNRIQWVNESDIGWPE